MSYVCHKSFLVCDPASREIQLKDHKRKVWYLEDMVYLTISNPLYPFAMPICLLAQGVFAAKLAHISYKIKKTEKKISDLKSTSSESFEDLKTKREAKLHRRLEKAKGKIDQRVQEREMQEVSHEQLEKVTEKYIKLNEEIQDALDTYAQDISDNDYGQGVVGDIRDSYEKTIDLSVLALRTQSELEALNAVDIDIKKMFIDRAECSLLRHKISKGLCLHELKNIAKMEIPFFGLLYFYHSKKTTADDLDEGLISQYNNMVRENPWMKMFKTEVG